MPAPLSCILCIHTPTCSESPTHSLTSRTTLCRHNEVVGGVSLKVLGEGNGGVFIFGGGSVTIDQVGVRRVFTIDNGARVPWEHKPTLHKCFFCVSSVNVYNEHICITCEKEDDACWEVKQSQQDNNFMLTTRIATVFESLERQAKLARQHNSCWFPIQHDYAGMKITAGHQPKSVHIARLAIYITPRLVIMYGQTRDVCALAILLSPHIKKKELCNQNGYKC